MLNTAMRFMSECDRVGLKYRDCRDLDNGESVVVCGVNGKNNAIKTGVNCYLGKLTNKNVADAHGYEYTDLLTEI